MSNVNQKLFSDQHYRPDPDVFDALHLQRQTFDQTSLQGEILRLFFAQISDTRRGLEEALTDRDWLFVTHTFKGAAGAVGATALAKLVGQWEADGLPRSTAMSQALLDRFDSACVEFREAALAYCQQL